MSCIPPAIDGRVLILPLRFQNFFPTLAKATFNYDNNVINLLLAAPPYIFMVIWSLLHSLASDRVGNRFWFFIYPVPIVLVGCFIFMFVENNGARYFSLFLMIFIFAMNGTVSLYQQSQAKQILTLNRPTHGSQTPFPALQPNEQQHWHSSTASEMPPRSGRHSPTSSGPHPITTQPWVSSSV